MRAASMTKRKCANPNTIANHNTNPIPNTNPNLTLLLTLNCTAFYHLLRVTTWLWRVDGSLRANGKMRTCVDAGLQFRVSRVRV